LKTKERLETGMKVLQPSNWKRPKGYSNGVEATGRTVFISGMVGWNTEEEFTSTDLAGQVRQALANIVEVLSEANAKPSDIVRMTWYLIDKKEYLSSAKEIGAAYREIIGRHFPAMTVVQVSGLLEDKARVEIEVTAVVA
jgi:enamine deaminase RidA (YjgF/YER057c/UK114 family)